MQRLGGAGQAVVLAAGLLLIWAVYAFALVTKGGLYLGQHEGDTLHLLEIVLRQAEGEWPHLDFMTPIGVLAGAPLAFFVDQGMGIGRAILYGQALVALILLPAVWWVGASRMGLRWGLILGFLVVALTCALVFGQAQRSATISMHYNRWAWAMAFIALLLALLPAKAFRSETLDGVLIGLLVAGMALIKATYVAALFPPILLALVLHKSWRTIIAGALAGLSVVVVVTLMAGLPFWSAYFGDLLTVASSKHRSAPGADLMTIAAGPAYLGGTLALLVGVMLLRRSGHALEGLVLLTLLPGFLYITYQNFGNDPQWLFFLALLLFALRPPAEDEDTRKSAQYLALTGCAALMLALPSALNLAGSPFRHLATPVEEFSPFFDRHPVHDDVFLVTKRFGKVRGNVELAGFPDPAAPEVVIAGEALPGCEMTSGALVLLHRMAKDLEGLGLQGKGLLFADLYSNVWMFGDFRRLHGGTPWYYGDLPGGDDADVLVVPLCPLVLPIRSDIMAEVTQKGWELSELGRTPHLVAYNIQRP